MTTLHDVTLRAVHALLRADEQEPALGVDPDTVNDCMRLLEAALPDLAPMGMDRGELTAWSVRQLQKAGFDGFDDYGRWQEQQKEQQKEQGTGQ